jgi:hypothetical protein
MTTKQEIALDPSKLYGFKIIARDQSLQEKPALSSSISSKIGDKGPSNAESGISQKIGSKVGMKSRPQI